MQKRLLIAFAITLGLCQTSNTYAEYTKASAHEAKQADECSSCSGCRTKTSCSDSNECSNWISRAKAWFSDLFGSKTTRDEASVDSTHQAKHLDASADNDDDMDTDAASEGETTPFIE